MNVVTRQTMMFFTGYVFVMIALTSFLEGYLENGTALNNPLFILGSGVLSAFLFHWIARGLRK